jgi:hypothetical protein
MSTAVRRNIAALAAAIAFFASAPSAAATDAQTRARTAVGYIASQQKANGSIPAFSPIGSTADAVLSMVAAGRGKDAIDGALAYLKRQVKAGKVTAVGLQAKVVMAVVAAGRDPRAFGGVNLLAILRALEQPDGRYGASTAVFDDALVMLALEASGRQPSASAVGWLAIAQCDDGGWQYDQPATSDDDEHCHSTSDPGSDWFESDTNTTAIAVMALDAAGGTATAADPFAFFDLMRDATHGGWGFTWTFADTDANSTALVIQAYAAAGQTLPTGAMTALKALQDTDCGAWSLNWSGSVPSGPDIGATIGGVLGVLRRPLPVPHAEVTKQAPATPACT